MQIFRLLVFVLLLIFIADLHADAGYVASKATQVVKEGIAATNAITNIVSGVKILAKFTEVMGKVAPFLNAIGPIMSIITLALPKQEDPTLTYLKEQFSKVDSNFRNMERLFSDVTNLVRSKALKSQFSGIEQNIQALSYRLHMLLKAPKDGVNGQKSRFISAFEVSYQSAALKIYNGIMTKGSFTDNIPNEAMKYTNYDRKKMQKVMAGCVALLMSAVKINLAYLELKNDKVSYKMEKEHWEKNIKNVLKKVKCVDKTVKAAFETQKLKDLENLSAQHKQDSHAEFAKRLYNFYSTKYDWMDFVVIVYNQKAESETGNHGHGFKLCGGDKYLQKDGRNVLTSSVIKEKPKIDIQSYQAKMSQVTTETVVLGVHYPWSAQSVIDALNRMSGYDVCMRAAISDRAGAQVQSAPGRLAYKWKYFYNMYLFG